MYIFRLESAIFLFQLGNLSRPLPFHMRQKILRITRWKCYWNWECNFIFIFPSDCLTDFFRIFYGLFFSLDFLGWEVDFRLFWHEFWSSLVMLLWGRVIFWFFRDQSPTMKWFPWLFLFLIFWVSFQWWVLPPNLPSYSFH